MLIYNTNKFQMNNKDVNQENKKRMFTIGYEVPGHSKDLICIRDGKSLMDADFLLIAPKQLYSLRSDSDYEAVSLFEKEIEDFLKYGKNIFVFLSEKVSYGEFDNYSF